MTDPISQTPEDNLRTILTPLGKMTPAQYAAYVASLTPDPIKLSYTTLSLCGHKFSAMRFPRGGCQRCWDTYFHANPNELVGLKMVLNEGKEAELVHRFGKEAIKQAKRLIQFEAYLASLAGVDAVSAQAIAGAAA